MKSLLSLALLLLVAARGQAYIKMASPDRMVFEEIERTYLDECDTFVAHNVPFDRSPALNARRNCII